MTQEAIKKVYRDLKNGKTHSNCSCPSCLYYFVKSRNEKTRIDDDNFFLYWLAHVYSYTKDRNRASKFFSWNKDRIHDWNEILKLYYEITGQRGRKCYFTYNREVPEQFRIISRYDKKFNLSGIINARDNTRIFAPIEISWFMFELENIFEIMRQHAKHDFPSSWSLSPENLEQIFYEFFKPVHEFSFKIFDYLSKEKREFSQREISRKCHINRDDLMLFLSYLEFRKLILWDKKNKRISLDPDWKFWLSRWKRDLNFIDDGLEKIKPFSISDAKELFNKGAN